MKLMYVPAWIILYQPNKVIPIEKLKCNVFGEITKDNHVYKWQPTELKVLLD